VSLDAMLVTLYQRGRLDLLRAIQDGTLAPLEVWDAYRSGDLSRLPDPTSLRPFRRTALAWAKKYQGRKGRGIHDRHRKELVAKLTKLADQGNKDATLADSADLLRDYRDACQEARTHRVFNYARAALMAFLRATVGARHRLYGEVAEIETLDKLATPPRKAHTPDEARAIRDQLRSPLGDIWWMTCCSGMGPEEFWGSWETTRDGALLIRGTKRHARVRRVPLLVPMRPPERSYQVYRKALPEGVTPYDARRNYAHWLELAGIPRARIKLYMGHQIGDVLDLYTRHEVDRWLPEDGNRLRAVLGEAPALLRVVK
jgi:hypothetical protein